MVAIPAMGGGGMAAMNAMTNTINMRSSINGSQHSQASSSKPTRMSSASLPTTAAGPVEKAPIPLSARHAEALDLSTVERRGQPTASKEPDYKVSRPHGLKEAPTFRPTEEEFKNPMEYIRKIAPEGRKFGILKIIPPDGWNPDFAVDTEVRDIPPGLASKLVVTVASGSSLMGYAYELLLTLMYSVSTSKLAARSSTWPKEVCAHL
jgi:histone demethylase JARID1